MSRFNSHALTNLRNRQQGPFPRVVFVCSVGMMRSATAAHLFASKYSWNTRAAGVLDEWAVQPLTHNACVWADHIICMTRQQEKVVLRFFPAARTKVTTLDIPDDFDYRQKELEVLLEQTVWDKLYGEFDDRFKPPALGGRPSLHGHDQEGSGRLDGGTRLSDCD